VNRWRSIGIKGRERPSIDGGKTVQGKTQLEDLESRLVRGAVGGAFAGLLFLLANMWYADSQGLPAVAPMLDISTIFHFSDQPEVSPENVAIGLIVHMALSMGFGMAFALAVPLLTNARMLIAGALGFGIALYLFNFQVLGRLFFEWFQEGPNQLFELFIHAAYGLLLVPFFASSLRPRVSEQARSRSPASPPAYEMRTP
jgi:hypothetical protein